ncbi:hypothetical protein M378DRAFT_99969 [Amanita muscaria Koide BX008]|uniref:Major facilitator superfamily (MFS) profile domain-containing protein n=1 Tax=Amanita muscaria (strain Koide BX008) TaxID=946122 RepID=A0A0C2TMP9_AMAMK|nr:hypothetical protein M378DRAFT_99969 [Amanita muscaria Koide BX008]
MEPTDPARNVTERDPLLSSQRNPKNDAGTNHGPLDISQSTRHGILAGVWLGSLLSSLNQTLVPTMLVPISSEFQKSNQASWLGTAYLLATCTFTPLYGRLCDAMGRRAANHTALLFACSGVLLCGLSNSMEALILARFLCGIGGGGLNTTAQIVVSDMYSLRNRGLAQGVASLFSALGMGLGGPLGGLVSDWIGWRWAFLIQMPLFLLSFLLTTWHLDYVTPGKGKSARDIIKSIDYIGSAMLLIAVGATLVFLSVRYNEGLPWSNPIVPTCFALAIIFSILFLIVELFVASQPVLPPVLLREKVPVLVGMSNFLVSMCNFSVIYFFPLWFQTVMLTSASVAGLHLLPNSISSCLGSFFAGWLIHYTGRYKVINVVFGVFPFIGATLISQITEDSGSIQSWISIIPLGFGNAVVLQTMLIALLAHLSESQIAVGTGFSQLFRGIGQVGGVAISSALFQSKLDTELHARIHTPDAEELIQRIRQSARLVFDLPPDIQRAVRDAYAASLKLVFILAACSTLLAFIVRLPVSLSQIRCV